MWALSALSARRFRSTSGRTRSGSTSSRNRLRKPARAIAACGFGSSCAHREWAAIRARWVRCPGVRDVLPMPSSFRAIAWAAAISPPYLVPVPALAAIQTLFSGRRLLPMLRPVPSSRKGPDCHLGAACTRPSLSLLVSGGLLAFDGPVLTTDSSKPLNLNDRAVVRQRGHSDRGHHYILWCGLSRVRYDHRGRGDGAPSWPARRPWRPRTAGP